MPSTSKSWALALVNGRKAARRSSILRAVVMESVFIALFGFSYYYVYELVISECAKLVKL